MPEKQPQVEKSLQLELLSRLSEQQWKEIISRVMIFILSKSYYKPHEAEDLVQEAILKIWSYERPIPQSFIGDVCDINSIMRGVGIHLCSVVRSLRSHLRDKMCRTEYRDSIEDEEIFSTAEGQEDEVYVREMVDYIYRVAPDEQAKQIVQIIGERPDLKPREVASEMNISVTKFQNAKKRIYRSAWDLLHPDSET